MGGPGGPAPGALPSDRYGPRPAGAGDGGGRGRGPVRLAPIVRYGAVRRGVAEAGLPRVGDRGSLDLPEPGSAAPRPARAGRRRGRGGARSLVSPGDEHVESEPPS